MQTLEMNELKWIEGGTCTGLVLGAVAGAVGIGLLFAFPPAGMFSALAGGIAEGASIYSSIDECIE